MAQTPNPSFYFMHVGKTGGTFASNAMRKLDKRAELNMVFGSHKLQLPQIVADDPNAQVIFGIRDPLEIFVSGFFSRQRKGAPNFYSEWSPREEKAFTTFATPNDLAEALNAKDRDRLSAARNAMNAIQHVKKCLNYYLASAATLEKLRAHVFFILDQSHLDEDLDRLYARFGLKVPKAVRQDQDRKHRNPASLDTQLSPTAIANLRRHYSNDIEIYHKCREIREDILRSENG